MKFNKTDKNIARVMRKKNKDRHKLPIPGMWNGILLQFLQKYEETGKEISTT